MKLRKYAMTIAVLTGLCASVSAWSQPVGHALVYIDPQDYQHETRLWHFYYSYWLSPAAAVEPIALDALQPLFAQTGLCRGGEAADVIVSIKPNIFYNPHMTMFYGDVVAQAYSGSGKPIATYRAEAQTSGFLDVQPAAKIKAVYQDAMQKIVTQMRADTAFMALVNNGLTDAETKMPCEMVSVLHPKQ